MGAVQRDRVTDRLNAGCSAETRRSAPSLALIFFGHVDVDARYRPVGAPLSFLTLLPSSALPIFHILNSHRALSVLRGHKDWTRNRFLSFTCVVSGICHGCSAHPQTHHSKVWGCSCTEWSLPEGDCLPRLAYRQRWFANIVASNDLPGSTMA